MMHMEFSLTLSEVVVTVWYTLLDFTFNNSHPNWYMQAMDRPVPLVRISNEDACTAISTYSKAIKNTRRTPH